MRRSRVFFNELRSVLKLEEVLLTSVWTCFSNEAVFCEKMSDTSMSRNNTVTKWLVVLIRTTNLIGNSYLVTVLCVSKNYTRQIKEKAGLIYVISIDFQTFSTVLIFFSLASWMIWEFFLTERVKYSLKETWLRLCSHDAGTKNCRLISCPFCIVHTIPVNFIRCEDNKSNSPC